MSILFQHRYFHMAGRILGKALMDGQITPVHLIQPLYKHLMGWPVTFKVRLFDSLSVGK